MAAGTPLPRLARLVAGARRLVVLTGAGISTESGIPDYRGGEEHWACYGADCFTYDAFVGSAEVRRRYWRAAREFFALARAAEPNRAHRALVELEREGVLDAVVTQNVDGLHRRAGHAPARLVEIHGTAEWIRCLGCRRRLPAVEVYAALGDGEAPACPDCGGILKPDVVMFNEWIPASVAAEAAARVDGADALLVVGSSLLVQPCASLATRAKDAGARVGIVNLSATPYDGEMDVIVRGKACDVLPRVLADVRRARIPA